MTVCYVATTGNNANDGLSEGNAWADPGYASGQLAEGDICYVKSGTYNLSNTVGGTAGGPVLFPADLHASIIGYETVPGDMGARPVIVTGAHSPPAVVLMNTADNQKQLVCNLDVNASGATGTNCFEGDSSGRCFIASCNATGGVLAFHKCVAHKSKAASATNVGFSSGYFYNCIADTCDTGFDGLSVLADCIAGNSALYGFGNNLYRASLTRCIAYGSGGSGFRSRATYTGNLFTDCVSIDNGGYGFQTEQSDILRGCVDYGNTTARSAGNEMVDLAGITLTGDPFVDAANGDFNLNDTAGAGAVLRALEYSL